MALRKNFSLTYVNILDLLFRLGRKATAMTVYGNNISGNRYEQSKSTTTALRLTDPISISNTHIWEMCTTAEWHLVGRIINEMKEYCALWYCKPELKGNSSIRASIKGLIEKGILIETETTNIYLVNPQHIRRGELFAVLATTADTLADESVVTTEHIRDRRPVKKFESQLPSKPVSYIENDV